MSEKEHLERVVKAWDQLFPLGDDDKTMWRVSEMLRLEGYEMFRLRDAVRGRKSGGEYADIDEFSSPKMFDPFEWMFDPAE